MKIKSLTFIVIMLFAGCSRSPSIILNDYISTFTKLTEILEGIKSEEDYNSAKQDIDSMTQNLEDIHAEFRSLKDNEVSGENGAKVGNAMMKYFNVSLACSSNYSYRIAKLD